MNTATRTIHQSDLTDTTIFTDLLSRRNLSVIVLALSVFLSCISVVYVKDINRRLSVQSQMIAQQSAVGQTDWGKLLLEQSAWSMQARIERIASTDFDMQLPSSNAVVMVRE